MSATSRKSSIHFAGPPSNLVAATDLALKNVTSAFAVVAEEHYPLRFVTDGNTVRSLSFTMPNNTLPCSLAVEVIIDDFHASATAVVAVNPKAIIEPSAITLQVSSGEKLTQTLRVTNSGNSELTLNAEKVVTLRPSGKLGRNIAKALKRTDRDIADRLIDLGELMNKEQHHELSVNTSMSPATVEVNKSAQVVLEIAVPEDIKASTAWTGSLAMLGTRLRISVEAISTTRPSNRSASR